MQDMSTRRSQAERKAGICAAVLEATVEILHENGYGATTVAMIAERAGISRGAMTNHFPTKGDLMTFVVEAVYEDELREYARLLPPPKDGHQRILAYPDVMWKVLSRPCGVAVLEIIMGSRSDPSVARKLRPVQDRIEADSFGRLERELGRPPLKPLVKLVTWAIRGLSIEQMLGRSSGSPGPVRLLQAMIEQALKEGAIPRTSTGTPQ